MHKQVVKGTRWLLLKNPENLDQGRKEHERLTEALRLNEPLARAYYLKEDLGQLWEQSRQAAATTCLADRIARAEFAGIPRLRKFTRTLALHRRGLLAYDDYPIATGPLEGTHNQIKPRPRQS